MAKKVGVISYTLATVASICFMSGLLVLTGGEQNHGKNGENHVSNKQYAQHKA